MALNEMTEGADSADQTTKKPLPAKSQIDLQALAERVVHLLKQDARIERERLGESRPGTKKVPHA